MVDSRDTQHICVNREAFASYTSIGDDNEIVYPGDSRTTKVLVKGKLLLKLTSEKTLVLTDVLNAPTMCAKQISLALINKTIVNVPF